MEKHCPQCHTKFTCSDACWCSAFPPIVPLVESRGCLCPGCLKSEVQHRIAIWVSSLTPQKIKTVQKMGLPDKLIEGIDYTLNEQGFFVFSAWYLLRQGKCCGNGCQNCPYQNIEKS